MDGNQEPHAGGGSATETDVQVVMTRAARVWAPTVVNDWLWGANSYLDGARPIDVLHLRGPAELLEALDAAEAGAFG